VDKKRFGFDIISMFLWFRVDCNWCVRVLQCRVCLIPTNISCTVQFSALGSAGDPNAE
jgi:hypothetical protein